MMRRSTTSARPGQVLLIAVLVIGAVILALGLGLARQGMAELSAGLEGRLSFRSMALADSCADEALLRLARDHSYVGGQAFDGGCSISVTGTGAQLRSIHVTANVQGWVRSLSVRASLEAGRLSILDWKQEQR